MKLIAIETCLGACSVAVIERTRFDAWDDAGRVVASRSRVLATGHAEHLFPMLAETLRDAGVSPKACDGIALTVGPGTFTGVRLGVAAARGLALAGDLPVYETTSLALVAAAAWEKIGARVELLTAADARNGQAYVQRFAASRGAEGPPALFSLAEAQALVGRLTWIAGTAAAALASESGGRAAGTLPGLEPDARYLAQVPLRAVADLKPLYMRPPDAKPQDGKSLPRVTP